MKLFQSQNIYFCLCEVRRRETHLINWRGGTIFQINPFFALFSQSNDDIVVAGLSLTEFQRSRIKHLDFVRNGKRQIMRFLTYSGIMPLSEYLCNVNIVKIECNKAVMKKKKLSVTCFSNERILYQDVSTLNDSDHTYQDWWLEMEMK